MALTMLAAAVALQVLPPPTLERWQELGRDERGNFAVDPQSIRRSGDLVTVLVRTQVHRGRDGQPYLGVMRYVYDCGANTVAMEAADIYSGDGDFIGSSERATAAEAVPPDTPNATTRDHVCGAAAQ